MIRIHVWTRYADREGENFLQYMVVAPSKRHAMVKVAKKHTGDNSNTRAMKMASSFFAEAVYDVDTTEDYQNVVVREN